MCDFATEKNAIVISKVDACFFVCCAAEASGGWGGGPVGDWGGEGTWA